MRLFLLLIRIGLQIKLLIASLQGLVIHQVSGEGSFSGGPNDLNNSHFFPLLFTIKHERLYSLPQCTVCCSQSYNA